METTTVEFIHELIEKWEDVRDCADDPVEKTLAEEILDDLHELVHYRG